MELNYIESIPISNGTLQNIELNDIESDKNDKEQTDTIQYENVLNATNSFRTNINNLDLEQVM